jgi:hypothetical protein
MVPLPIGTKNVEDFITVAVPSINPDACLALMVQCTGTASGFVTGQLYLSQE